MADVWISRKRWTCKYCDITINDDLPSRRHHETGVRHKQNVRKALQDLYRKGEQERKDAEHMKKEMARIEALAAESYAKDQASSDGPVASTSRSAELQSATLAQAKAQPGSAHLARPKARPAPAERYTEASLPVAQPGEWEQVQPVASASTTYVTEASDRDRARSFRVREKMARLDDSDDESDLTAIKIKKRPRDDAAAVDGPSMLQRGVKKEEQTQPVDPIKEEADRVSQQPLDANTMPSVSMPVKKEGGDGDDAAASATTDDGSGSLFKKRRAGAGAGAKRVRAVI